MGTTNIETPDAIVKRCSAGAMLRGVLHGISKDKSSDKVDVFRVANRQLVKIPKNLELLPPEWKEWKEGRIELDSKQELDAFEESIMKTEISLDSKDPKLKFKGVFDWNENAGKRQKTKVGDPEQETDKETKFYSVVSYTMIPTKSLKVGKKQLELSQDALNALTSIHKQVDKKRDQNDKRRHLYHLCTEFFRNFGSHFNCGLFHLGGILTTTSTFEGVTELSNDTVNEIVSSSLEAYTKAELSESGITMSAKWLKEQGKISQHVEDADLENIRVSRQQYGGRLSMQASTKDDWTTKLSEDSTTWVVIDRGVPGKDDCHGVWDLLDLLSKDIFDGESMRQRLHNILYEFFNTFQYRNKIYRIMATGIDPESIRKALCDIEETTKGRPETEGVRGEWSQLLVDDRKVVQFLLTLEHHLQHLHLKQLEEIGKTMNLLLKYVGYTDFQDKGKIYQLRDKIFYIAKGKE